MKPVLLFSCLIIFTFSLCAQYTTKGDFRYTNQTFTIIEGNMQNEWVKGEIDTPQAQTIKLGPMRMLVLTQVLKEFSLL